MSLVVGWTTYNDVNKLSKLVVEETSLTLAFLFGV